jgi:hypothetical protein
MQVLSSSGFGQGYDAFAGHAEDGCLDVAVVRVGDAVDSVAFQHSPAAFSHATW